MKQPKPKPDISADLMSFAYWIVVNRMVWLGVDITKTRRKDRWKAAASLFEEWRKSQ